MCICCSSTPTDVVEGHVQAIEDLPLRRDRGGSDYLNDRRRAAAGIRAQVRALGRQLRDSRAETAAAHTATSDTAFAGMVAQQLARFLDIELDFAASEDSNRQFSVTGGCVASTLDLSCPTLTVSHPCAGLRAADLTLSRDGLTASAVLMLAGLFGVKPTRGNTPKALHDYLFEPEPEVPEGTATFFRGGSVIDIDLGGMFSQR